MEENYTAISEVLEKTLTNSIFTPKRKLSLSDVGHPRFPKNDTAEKLKKKKNNFQNRLKFRCVNSGESKDAQILLITRIS